MNSRKVIIIICLACGFPILGQDLLFGDPQVIGSSRMEWDHFKDAEPLPAVRHDFHYSNFPGVKALLVRQKDVKAEGWTVSLNGQKLGVLQTVDELVWTAFVVDSSLLKRGQNSVEVNHSGMAKPETFSDQIEVGPFKMIPYSELFAARVNIRVTSNDTLLPSRITIIDQTGALVPITNTIPTTIALRTGIAYAGTGEITLGLQPGKYTTFATRGPEYSLAEVDVHLAKGENPAIDLRLVREVDTAGWASVDTHIHTLTHSRHGDATADERVITIAAEGIELPIVTEHNLHVSYSDAARRMGMDKFFTLVQGNEVTTRRGHFNIFPVELNAPVPNPKEENWTNLFAAIRKTPQVQVIILNHPTDVHSGFVPFASTNLSPGLGFSPTGLDFAVDAIEVINSGAMNSDWMQPYRGWFALLNAGRKVVSVGSSDSHDVSRFAVGQGRTYVQVHDSNPSRIDLDAAIAALKNGRSFISLGLFPRITVNNSGPGSLVQAPAGFVDVHLSVDLASWMKVDKIQLFGNGLKLREITNTSPSSGPLEVTSRLKLPKNDLWLVAIASGPGIRSSYWPIPRPYQPSSTSANSPALGSTNPIWIDTDADGKFTAPRQWAQKLLAESTVHTFLLKSAACDSAVLDQAQYLIESGQANFTAAQLIQAQDLLKKK